jgi:hypothetical protein
VPPSLGLRLRLRLVGEAAVPSSLGLRLWLRPIVGEAEARCLPNSSPPPPRPAPLRGVCQMTDVPRGARPRVLPLKLFIVLDDGSVVKFGDSFAVVNLVIASLQSKLVVAASRRAALRRDKCESCCQFTSRWAFRRRKSWM